MATTKLMTAEDLWEMGEDARFCELIRGELACMSPASGKHSQTTGVIFGHLWTFARHDRSHEVFESSAGYIIARDPDVVLAPDVSVVRSERFPPDGPRRRFMDLVPDLVVDVISPSERPGHITTKIVTYLNTGVRIVWLVDLENRSITVHAADRPPRTLTIDDELDGGEVLPGFRLRVADIFS